MKLSVYTQYIIMAIYRATLLLFCKINITRFLIPELRKEESVLLQPYIQQ